MEVTKAYRAFLSYSHALDGRLAAEVQACLHRFARPWYRAKAIRTFRDKTNLSVTPALWPSIRKAITQSEFFILFASPQASASPWVTQELECWLEVGSADRLLMILTEGEIRWNRSDGTFKQAGSSAVPPVLAKAFRDEPLYWIYAGREENRTCRSVIHNSGRQSQSLRQRFTGCRRTR